MDISSIVEKFKNREVKAKKVFEIREIDKDTAYQFIRRYHYLGDAKFFSMYCYGLYIRDTNYLIGSATYSLPQGKDSNKGWWGLLPNDQSIVELSRLCMLPCLNGTNATSFLLGNSVKLLKQHHVRAIITLADASRHIGSIYQVCNFTYYGLTKSANDFYREDGVKNPRGECSNWHGIYLPRNRKHRYAFILDKTLKCNYNVESHPTTKGVKIATPCCDNTYVVYDNRFNEYWTCPRCTSKMTKITKEEYDSAIDLHNKGVSQEELKKFVEDIILRYRKQNKETYEEDLF